MAVAKKLEAIKKPVRPEHISAIQELNGSMRAVNTYLNEDHGLGRHNQILENIDEVQYKILQALNEAIHSCEKYCDLDLSDLVLLLAKELLRSSEDIETRIDIDDERRVYNLFLNLAKYENSSSLCNRDIQVFFCCQNALDHINKCIFYIEGGDVPDLESAWANLSLAYKDLGGAQILLDPVISDIEAMIVRKRRVEKVKAGSARYFDLKTEAVRLSKTTVYLSEKSADIAQGIYLDLRRFADNHIDKNGKLKPLIKLSENREIKTISGWINEDRKTATS